MGVTPAELALPWRTYALAGYAPWRLVVRRGEREIPLAASEVLALCAVVELERMSGADVDDLLYERRRRRKPWTFAALTAGARGLRPEDAPGEMSLAEVLRLAGLEFVRSEVRVRAEHGPRSREGDARGPFTAIGGVR